MALTPFKFQEEVLQEAVGASKILVLDAGLGKTLTSIHYALRTLGDKKGTVIVVVPKSTKLQWTNVLLSEVPNLTRPLRKAQPQGPSLYVIKTQKELAALPKAGVCQMWVLIHWDQLILGWGSEKKTGWRTSFAMELNKLLPDIIIADEVHRVKNRQAKRSIALTKINAFYKVGLTATPVEKSAGDFWHLLHWLDAKKFSSYWRFHAKFVLQEEFSYQVDGELITRKRDIGTKNHEELAPLVAPYVIRVTKKDVADELPGMISTIVDVEMTPPQKKAYLAVESAKDFEIDVGTAEPLVISSVIAQLVRLHQIASSPLEIGLDDGGGKLQWLKEFADDCPDRLLVFTAYRKTAQTIAEQFGAGLIIGGDTSGYKKFKAGNVNMVVGTIAAMSEGIDFPEPGITSVFFSTVRSSILMEQARNRTHRITVREPRNLIFLQSQGTVDPLYYEAMQGKFSDQQMLWEYYKKYRLRASGSHISKT
jgi:SNF2 family DNA or RNA helicase